MIGKMLMDNMEKALEEKQGEVQRQIKVQQSQDELDGYVESVNEVLLKIFQQYCSFGDPLNTEKLKSGKFIKLF